MPFNTLKSFALSSLSAITLLAAVQPATAQEMKDHPTVQLRALDKITARTLTFEASVGATVKFGSLFIKAQSCRKSPPVETPESAAFLQIWEEHQSKEKSLTHEAEISQEWVFSGWMFASSPALSYMDHPIYDVWVLDCLEQENDEINIEDGTLLEGEGQISGEDAKNIAEPELSDEQVVTTPSPDDVIINSEELPAPEQENAAGSGTLDSSDSTTSESQ